VNQYLNSSGKSGIEAYKICNTSIAIKFKSAHKIYTYSYQFAGKDNVDNMKTLAQNGQGLNSYIIKNVKYLYDK
jgi:hypothetical protein